MAYTTIDNPELYFQCKLYTGNGSTQTITYDNTDADLDADMIWLKARNHAYSHQLFDTVRGANELLNPEATDAEQTLSGITAFATDSFSIGSDAGTNANTKTYVAWCWKETADAGFDIVTYAGDAVAGRNISHSLGAVPHMMIVKNRTNAIKWAVYHHRNTAAPETDHLQLNDNVATSDDDSTWDDTAPTSSVFRVKSSTSTNGSSANYIAYLWTEKQGFSKFGSYTGNGSADGTYVYTGFRPAFVLFKGLASNREWILADNKRDPINEVDAVLYGNTTDLEGDSDMVDFLSNGFKHIHASGPGTINTSGETYIYMAYAEQPFVNSNGVPGNAR